MQKLQKVGQDFQWISDGFSDSGKKHKIFYKSFCLNDFKVEIGDFVLVRNDDALDPEDFETCFIAEIKDLFDTGEESDSHRAKVQWFSRTCELPTHVLKYLDKLNFHEVVEEKRYGLSDIIDAETVFHKCVILFFSAKDDYASVIEKTEGGQYPVFFCRYKFNGIKLKPNNTVNKSALFRSRSFCFTTPDHAEPKIPCTEKKHTEATSKKYKSTLQIADIYCATTVGDPAFPKVVIKKLDKRITNNGNKNIRIFVADSNPKSINDITESLKNKLNFKNLTKDHADQNQKESAIHALNIDSISKIMKMNDCDQNETNSVISDVILSPKLKSSKNNVKRSLTFEATAFHTEDSKQSKNGMPKKVINFKNRESNLSPQKKQKIMQYSNVPVDRGMIVTRSGRKVKINNYTEEESCTKSNKELSASITKKTPSKFVRDSYTDSESSFSADESSESDSVSDCSALDEKCTPRSAKKCSAKKRSASKKNSVQSFSSKKKVTSLIIPNRKTPLKTPQNVLEESRQRLHVSAVPKSLPCRGEEYSDIYTFVKGCLCANTGGCMYISGVPGTGKTATVHEVMRNLQEEKESGEIPLFTFVEINGMWMTDPYQCYVQIYKCLTGKTIASQQAASLLEKRFTEPGPKKDAVVLLVDELDRLWTRKQTVMYNIFDWPTKKHSKLVVLAIANTMDLPERLMMNRISSRLGLTRRTFQPYTFRQLQQIIMSRIEELKVFDPDAVQLVSRKVAAVSGDARRALDICRFATEVVRMGKASPRKKNKILVGMEHVDIALQQMFSSPLVSAVRACSNLAKLFLRCVLSEFKRTGTEETVLIKVHQQMVSCCRFDGLCPPNSSEAFDVCAHLAASHLVLVDNFQNDLFMKIRLNVSSDDINYALMEKL